MNVDQESVLRLSRRRTTQIMMNIHKALVFVGFLSNANAYDVERAPPLREHSFSKPFQGKLLQKDVPPLSLCTSGLAILFYVHFIKLLFRIRIRSSLLGFFRFNHGYR